MFNTLEFVTPQEVIFPHGWSASSRAMAKTRDMTQGEVDAVEADLQAFRAKSAVHAEERKADEKAFEVRWRERYRRYSWSGDITEKDAIAKFRAMAIWTRGKGVR